MKKFILFDHDGVLVDTEYWYFKAGERALAEIGFVPRHGPVPARHEPGAGHVDPVDLMLDPGASVPSGLRHDRFVATPLTTSNAKMDYASYMASPEVIQIHSDGRWPVEGFTLADDLELVARHQEDHQARRAFTFVLLSPEETEALGCFYLNPLRDYFARAGASGRFVETVSHDSAMATFWLRQDHQETDLADAVVSAVNSWLIDEWPLTTALFRVLPAELSSCAALDRLGLATVHVSLPADEPPYIWYQSAPRAPVPDAPS